MVDSAGLFCHSIKRLPRSQGTQSSLHVDVDNGQAVDITCVDPSKAV